MYHIEQEIEPPVSLFEWLVAYLILFVPFLNVILLVFWSVAKDINPSKANWARATLIVAVIFTLLWFLFLRALFGK